MTATLSTGFVDLDRYRLAYDEMGTGPAVVFVHAGVCDRRMWDGPFQALADSYRVVRFDALGFGESVVPDGADGLVVSRHGDLIVVLDALGIERTVLVGCSLGGTTALDAALVAPERVSGLVLVSTRPSGSPHDPEIVSGWRAVDRALDLGDLESALEFELRMWVDGPFREPDAVDLAVRDLVGEMDRIALSVPEGAFDEAPLDPPAIGRLAEVRAPTLIVTGALDYPAVVRSGEEMAARIPGARLVTIEGAAHLPSLEHPERFTDLVRAFLKETVE